MSVGYKCSTSREGTFQVRSAPLPTFFLMQSASVFAALTIALLISRASLSFFAARFCGFFSTLGLSIAGADAQCKEGDLACAAQCRQKFIPADVDTQPATAQCAIIRKGDYYSCLGDVRQSTIPDLWKGLGGTGAHPPLLSFCSVSFDVPKSLETGRFASGSWPGMGDNPAQGEQGLLRCG
jgi:hypothetical protein